MEQRPFSVVLAVLAILLLLRAEASSDCSSKSSKLHRKTYHSPAFALGPGEVQDRYYSLEFPPGHLGIKNFHGELVDELGISVPLTEVYLHHWVVFSFYRKKSSEKREVVKANFHGADQTDTGSIAMSGNDGICQHQVLSQFWGLGSETRHTDYFVPGSYAIGVGDRSKIPEGYEEVWGLNVHAIDTRGTDDPQGCNECRCDLYNVTRDAQGRPLKDGYKGGLHCCYEGTRCRVREGYEAPSRTLYLQYTVEWVDWDECVLPVRAYIFDITDTKERDPVDRSVGCKIEYDVPACDSSSNSDCKYLRENDLVIPKGGSIVYGVAHQHAGGQWMAVHGEDGRHLCASVARYGNGSAPGNEAGYVVGMSTCFPEFGTVTVKSGETLRFSSLYSSAREHTGVMALFYLIVADDDDAVALGQFKGVGGGNMTAVTIVIVVVVAVVIGVSAWMKRASHSGYTALP